MMKDEKTRIERQRANLDYYRFAIDAARKLYPYGWFITHKFKSDRELLEGLAKIDGWRRHNAMFHNAHLLPFQGYEPVWTPSRLSSHEILLSDTYISTHDLKGAWRHGHLDIRKYDPSMGAARYIPEWHIMNPTNLVCSLGKGCKRTSKGKVLCRHQIQRRLIY